MIFNPRDLAYLGSAQASGATLGFMGSGYSGSNGTYGYTWDFSDNTYTLISATFFTSGQAGNAGTLSGNSEQFFWSGNEYSASAVESWDWNGTSLTSKANLPWGSYQGNAGGTVGDSGDHATVNAGYYKGTNWHATWNGSSWANGSVTLNWSRSPVSGGSESGSFIATGGYGSTTGGGGQNLCAVTGGGSGSGTTGGQGTGSYGDITGRCETRGAADRSGGESWTNRASTNLTARYGNRGGVGDREGFFKSTSYSNCASPNRNTDTETWNNTAWTTETARPSGVNDPVMMGQYPDNIMTAGGYGSVTGGDTMAYRTDVCTWNGSAWTTQSTTLPSALEVTSAACCAAEA